jgi:hypothetical protein
MPEESAERSIETYEALKRRAHYKEEISHIQASNTVIATVFDCFVILLQGKHIHLVSLKGGNAACDGGTTRERSDTRHPVLHRCAANGTFVEEGTLAERSVQNEIDLAAFDHVHNVRPTFIDFVNSLYRDTALVQGRGRSTRGDQVETELMEPVGNTDDVLLIVLVHADEGRAERGRCTLALIWALA